MLKYYNYQHKTASIRTTYQKLFLYLHPKERKKLRGAKKTDLRCACSICADFR